MEPSIPTEIPPRFEPAKDQPATNDRLRMNFINNLPQPLFADTFGTEWPIADIEVETGLVRIDVCGLLEVKPIADLRSIRDGGGTIHEIEEFYSDYVPEDQPASGESYYQHKDQYQPGFRNTGKAWEFYDCQKWWPCPDHWDSSRVTNDKDWHKVGADQPPTGVEARVCGHRNRRNVGGSMEGMGSIAVDWCPDCGALKRTMTSWKYTDYPWELPKLPQPPEGEPEKP